MTIEAKPGIVPATEIGCEGHGVFDIRCHVCQVYWPEKVDAHITSDAALVRDLLEAIAELGDLSWNPHQTDCPAYDKGICNCGAAEHNQDVQTVRNAAIKAARERTA